jgi:hypothetical protein
MATTPHTPDKATEKVDGPEKPSETAERNRKLGGSIKAEVEGDRKAAAREEEKEGLSRRDQRAKSLKEGKERLLDPVGLPTADEDDEVLVIAGEPDPVDGAADSFSLETKSEKVKLEFARGERTYTDADGKEHHDKARSGVTDEALLAILQDRLESFQAGIGRNEHTAEALHFLKKLRVALRTRQADRQRRGIRGNPLLHPAPTVRDGVVAAPAPVVAA